MTENIYLGAIKIKILLNPAFSGKMKKKKVWKSGVEKADNKW